MGHASALVPLLVTALGATPVLADLQVREVRTNAQGAVLGERTVLVSANRLRIDDGDAAYCIDLVAGKWMLIDHASKTWRERALARSPDLDPERSDWKRRYEALAARVEDRRPQRVVPTAETRTIANVAAKKVEVFAGSTRIRESWHAAAVSANDIQTILLKVAESDPGMVALPLMNVMLQTAHLGYPILVRDLERGITVQARDIKMGPVPAQSFAVPNGYRKLED
jgi:hypothetical protein